MSKKGSYSLLNYVKAEGPVYRVNTLPRKVLITVDEVIGMTNTSHTLDPRTIDPAIIIAEERIVRPALGFNFYDHLRDLKNQIVTTANKVALEKLVNDSVKDALPTGEAFDKLILENGSYVNASIYLNPEDLLLWNEYLWKLTAEAVRFIALPQNYVQFTSQGLIHNNPVAIGLDGEKTTTPELRTTKWLMDKAMQDGIDPLIEAMHEWLCIQKKNNPKSFLLYNKPCDCDANGIGYKRKTDILTNIYDEEINSCGCNTKP